MNQEKKFATHDQRLLRTWDEIQQIQTDFCFAQELSAYYMSNCWLNKAHSVLDVGTGNGYFLNLLREKFPDKEYVGIDISEELIALARSRFQGTRIQLRVDDYFSVSGSYDFVITRLFWQHLPQARIEEALRKLTEITKPGGSVLVTDAYDEARCFVPDVPEFRKVISTYTQQQLASGRDRRIVSTLLDWVNTSSSWRVGSSLSLILPSSIPGYLRLYHRIYELWIELFECLGELDMDFSAAKTELNQWKKNARAFTQAGIRVTRLDRVV